MFKINLTTKIFIGLILGIIAGYFYRSTHALSSDYENFANNISILSDIFLRLIKMIIAPLVFSVLVVGIAKVGDFKSVGRMGIKTISYFYFATILALCLGLLLVNLFEPGKAMQLTLPPETAAS